MRISDWSSDVCSSDLLEDAEALREAGGEILAPRGRVQSAVLLEHPRLRADASQVRRVEDHDTKGVVAVGQGAVVGDYVGRHPKRASVAGGVRLRAGVAEHDPPVLPEPGRGAGREKG